MGLLSVHEYAEKILKKGLSYSHAPHTLDLKESSLKKVILGVLEEDELDLMRVLCSSTKKNDAVKKKSNANLPQESQEDSDQIAFLLASDEAEEEIDSMNPEMVLDHLVNNCSIYSNKCVNHDEAGTVHFDPPKFRRRGYFLGSSLNRLVKFETALNPGKNGLTKRLIVPYRVVRVLENPLFIEEKKNFEQALIDWESNTSKKKGKKPVFKTNIPEFIDETVKITSVADRLMFDEKKEYYREALGCAPAQKTPIKPKTTISSQVLWPVILDGSKSYANLYIVTDATIDFELKRRVNFPEVSEIQRLMIDKRIEEKTRLDLNKRPRPILESLPSCTSNVINGGILSASTNGMKTRFYTNFTKPSSRPLQIYVRKDFFKSAEFIEASRYIRSFESSFRLSEMNKKMKDSWFEIGLVLSREVRSNLNEFSKNLAKKSGSDPHELSVLTSPLAKFCLSYFQLLPCKFDFKEHQKLLEKIGSKTVMRTVMLNLGFKQGETIHVEAQNQFIEGFLQGFKK